MCGRYLLYSPVETLERAFGLGVGADRPNLKPRYNIAPTQLAPIVRVADGVRALERARWGLIPPWAEDDRGGARLINARGETVATKPSFRSAFKSRRCLVPADGFYEWTGPTKAKQPHLLEPVAGSPMALAGLYEWWRPEGDDSVQSFTIVTTSPNTEVAPLHNRMPVILAADAWDTWLSGEPAEAAKLIGPAPDGTLRTRPVSKRVGNVANDDPELIAESA